MHDFHFRVNRNWCTGLWLMVMQTKHANRKAGSLGNQGNRCFLKWAVLHTCPPSLCPVFWYTLSNHRLSQSLWGEARCVSGQDLASTGPTAYNRTCYSAAESMAGRQRPRRARSIDRPAPLVARSWRLRTAVGFWAVSRYNLGLKWHPGYLTTDLNRDSWASGAPKLGHTRSVARFQEQSQHVSAPVPCHV